MKTLMAFLTAAVLSATASAQQVAIVGAKVFTQTEQGVLESATVLIRDGKIERVTEGTEVPAGYRQYDASGKVVTPGLIGALTSLGLVEVASWAGTVDATAEPTPISKTGAALDVSYALNPDSTVIGVSRIEGFTAAATTLSDTHQLFNGQGAVITLGTGAPLIKPKAFMVVNVGSQGADGFGGSRAALWVALEQALQEASEGRVPGPESPWYGMNTRADLKALKGVIAGETVLYMEADRVADIRQVIAFKQRHPGLKLALLRATEGWRIADELAASKIPVVLNPQMNLPGNFDQLGATMENAARLEAAGVVMAIGMDTHNIRLATQHAGNAVANGLSHEGAIASLTSAPASILGVADQIGALAPGMRADLVVWSGDPLEITETAEQVFINGEPIEMTSRQSRLRDRYMKLYETTGNPSSHYIRP
ncbi:amidohydrolase [Alteromonas aestuariivivens]|uniref:Amidohydrolase n=1 Tax=Alteromonas aestuariivivens TaxID=1938339 RepID=A0A3D8M3R3_9ALTE|nr:amidohydrolase family protein [Alteromonas aestuariivivens]RDV24271.1 amidohydrolase [Alteromonas aestuariivivens]